MLGAFIRRNSDANRRKSRAESKQLEEECRRLINVVENLTEQRKECVEVIQLVNKGLNDLIGNLQKKNPLQNDKVTPIPEELLNTISTQLLNSIQAQIELDGELLDDDDDDIGIHNDFGGEDSGEYTRRNNDDGLKTELVILQSQINRLRTEQDKLITKIDQEKHQRNSNSHGESSSHIHKKKFSTGLNDSFNLSKESLVESDFSGINAGKDDDAYAELIRKQEKEINKLRQKIKIYEDQFKDHPFINGSTNGNNVNSLTNGVNGTNETTKEVKGEFKKLQRSFHTFTSVSDDEIEINRDAASKLLESYQLGSFQDNNYKTSKMRLAAALEAKISSLLNEKVEGYFATAMENMHLEEDYDEDNLELDLVTTTEKLVELLNKFVDVRANGDESLKKTSINLRSLIYSTISTSSFSPSENSTHPFIDTLVSHLLKLLDDYRTLPSSESAQVKKEAEQIILDFTSLVYFKLRSLDPRAKLFYYDQGTNVDENKMKGAWDKSNASNQEVDICYFPAVVTNQKHHGIISKAQVLTRRRY